MPSKTRSFTSAIIFSLAASFTFAVETDPETCFESTEKRIGFPLTTEVGTDQDIWKLVKTTAVPLRVPVGISGCFDERRLYNLEVKWGVYDEEGNVTDVKSSLSNLHGDVPISDQVTCSDIDIQLGYSIVGVQVSSSTSAIT